MTVLGLKLSRRANAVSSLHGEVSRAMWWGLFPGKPKTPCPSATSPTACMCLRGWLRRCAASTTGISALDGRQRSGTARTWEGIENVDDGELWETHLSLKSQLLDFVAPPRMEQAERRSEPQESLHEARQDRSRPTRSPLASRAASPPTSAPT